MRRSLLFLFFLLISFYCFAQQNLPVRIHGGIPNRNSKATYQIQVGAFSINANADRAFLQLQRNALNPVREKYQGLTRVMIRGIPANQVVNFLAIIKEAGFNEVTIRPDPRTGGVR